MSRLCEKLRIIRQVLKSDNSMLITFDEDALGVDYTGESLMFGQLFHSTVQYVNDWITNWRRINSIDHEID